LCWLRCAAFNCIIEGREFVLARTVVVVLGPNCFEFSSVSDGNSTQFGHQRHRGAAGARPPLTLSLDEPACAAKRCRRQRPAAR
jgi:hypothetical protein